MKHKMLALVGLFVSLGFLLQILYGCESKDTGADPVTQIKFYVDDSLYDAVIVRSDRFVMPPAPKKEGYRFEGWFCDAELSEAFKPERYVCDRARFDIEVYAKFVSTKSEETLPDLFQNFGQTIM